MRRQESPLQGAAGRRNRAPAPDRRDFAGALTTGEVNDSFMTLRAVTVVAAGSGVLVPDAPNVAFGALDAPNATLGRIRQPPLT
ncbi:hypothetical protein H4696_008554 [Amycolatopsis lexingtonensis]|uniref:Uncharacterized protein n=2 Tax=Amycolatopsis lexingtonensis TaxID=218822 RepID=A0ABR9IE56_9PSEU|nr:hypothetical protein [Amycolatopsis lexingtonensis]